MFDLCTISLSLPLIKSKLESPPLSFNVLNESIFADFLLKLLKPSPDRLQDLVHLQLLLIAFVESGLHLIDPGIECLGTSDLLEHFEETFLPLSDEAFDLALLHDLELRLPLKRKSARLKNIEQLLLLNVHAIKEIGVPSCVHVVGLLDFDLDTG